VIRLHCKLGKESLLSRKRKRQDHNLLAEQEVPRDYCQLREMLPECVYETERVRFKVAMDT
jgi:hypothetical protein